MDLIDKVDEETITERALIPITTASTSLIEHDRRGDLILNIGTDCEQKTTSKSFRVCSRTLARTSQVFDRMLYGGMAESNRKVCEPWTVDLPEDKPEAFNLWSNICHGQLHNIPPNLTIEQLFDLTSLTHYYDSTHMLVPWIPQWMSNLKEPPAEDELGMHKLLWISIELKRTQLSTSTARAIILESPGKVTEAELLQELSSVPLSDHITRMHSIRLQTIQAMLNLFHQLSNILTVVDEKPRWCRHASYMGPHRCESMILGSVIFCLTRAGLWPIPPAEDVKESVLSLFKKLTGIVVHDIGRQERGGKKGNGEDHSDCNPRQFLVERLQRILAEIPDPLLLVEGKRP